MSDEPGEPSLARHRCLVLSPHLFDALMASDTFCQQCSEQLAGTRQKAPRRRGAGLALHFSEDGSTALCGAALPADSLFVAVTE